MGAIDGGDSGSSPGTGGEAGGGRNQLHDLPRFRRRSGEIPMAPSEFGTGEWSGRGSERRGVRWFAEGGPERAHFIAEREGRGAAMADGGHGGAGC